MPYLRHSAWSMRWSSGFLKSSWITLWSTYWTARSTFTRGTSSCSNCISDIVPVASWSSVWSMRSAIGSPGSSSPSTRCSRRIWRVRFSAIASMFPEVTLPMRVGPGEAGPYLGRRDGALPIRPAGGRPARGINQRDGGEAAATQLARAPARELRQVGGSATSGLGAQHAGQPAREGSGAQADRGVRGPRGGGRGAGATLGEGRRLLRGLRRLPAARRQPADPCGRAGARLSVDQQPAHRSDQALAAPRYGGEGDETGGG